MDKQVLRSRLKGMRDAMPSEVRAQASIDICAHVSQFARGHHITRWGIFWPLGSEVNLRPLMDSHPEGTFYFPRVVTPRPPRLAWGQAPLEAGRWGLQEPIQADHSMPPVQLLLVPGLGFDLAGFRLGYGGGFYDALLAGLDAEVITLGVGFACQQVETLPLEPQDRAVHGWVSEQGLVLFRR